MEHEMRKEINKFKDFLIEKSKEKLNISDVMDSKEETIKIGGKKYKKILSSLSEISNLHDKIKSGIPIMEDVGYIKLPEDDKIYILLYSH